MYGGKLRYLAVAFVDAASIGNTADVYAAVARLFEGEEFAPVTISEPNPSGKAKSRIGLITPSGEWQLALLSNQVQFAQLPTDVDGTNFVEFADFCQRASNNLGKILSHFERRAHRLGIVQEGFLPDTSQDEMNTMALRVLHLPPTYQTHLPFEWDWRCASQIEREFGDIRDLTNTLVTIKRFSGHYESTEDEPPIEFDRIRVDLDVNTNPKNLTGRFGEKELRHFFEQAPAWHNQMESEIRSFLYGE